MKLLVTLALAITACGGSIANPTASATPTSQSPAVAAPSLPSQAPVRSCPTSSDIESWGAAAQERLRSATQDYLPAVRPDHAQPLKLARIPFASYVNQMHNRLHQYFANSYLACLDSLPRTHPLNRSDLEAKVELALDATDGRVVRMGIIEKSDVPNFDVGVLESIERAAPFGAAPSEIVSGDGNVYLHWEFYRNPYYACSTYFARPYLLR